MKLLSCHELKMRRYNTKGRAVCPHVAAVSVAFLAICTLFAAESSIPLLGWSGLPYQEATVARYSEAKDCGLTHLMQRVPGTNEAVRVLDMAAQAGIKLMLDSPQMHSAPEVFAAAVKDHPALALYHVKDEPSVNDMDKVGETCRRIRSADPRHPCYVNWFGRVHHKARRWYGVDTFDEYVKESLARIDVPFMSFDQYPVMNPGNFPGKVFRPPTGPCHVATNWYHTLETLHKFSMERGKPFWAFALVSALRHPPRDDYPIALPSHIRLQMYSNLAYGAQGLQYYYYGLTATKSKCMQQWAPIAPDGKLDSLHDRMREVNLELAARSFVFAGAKAVKVRHTGEKIPLETTRLGKDDLPPFVSSLETPDGGAVVSFLENGNDRYVVIVNRSPDQELTLRITLAPGTKRIRADGSQVDADRYTYEYWLDGGAAEIFKAPAKGTSPGISAAVTAKTFTVGCVNCGAFHYGNGRATPDEFTAAWKKLAADWPQAVFFYEDVGKGVPGNVSQPGFDIRADAKDQPRAVDIVSLPDGIETSEGYKKTHRHRVLRLTYERDGKSLAVYGGHLVAEGHVRGPKPAKGEPSLSQKLRQKQFKALLEDAKRYDYAILAGDFNAQKPWEYDIFKKAGFTIANCSDEYGTKATLRNIPADNIILSPGLSFADFKVLDGYVLDTDHFPLVANVRFAPAPAPAAVPSVEEFLKKPAAERRALFKDNRFRKMAFEAKYPDGPGLLSRWVRVENIPNLRDVGGILNKDGKELRRGVFYRSAGWNDNASTGKKKPESEWKKGKSRLTDAGRKVALEKMGIKTDLDLRSDRECWGMTGSPIGENVFWKHVSFGHYDEFEKKPEFITSVKETFATLADPARRPLVFHCIGGADRTGCLAFFIQALCDVDDDTLVKDWELTCCYTSRPSFVHEKCIDRLFAMLAKYPGATTKERVKAFLRKCGVTDADMESVRSALVSACGAGGETSGFKVAENGLPVADIVIPENAGGVERFAAEELRYHIGKAVGMCPVLAVENAFDPSARACHFFIGATKAASAAGHPGRTFKDDERLVRTQGNACFLMGGDSPMSVKQVTGIDACGARGTLYAVYDFLENEMGVKWIWPGETGEVVPRRDTIAIAPIDRTGREPLENRLYYGIRRPTGKKVYGFRNGENLWRSYEAQMKFLTRHRHGRRISYGGGHHFGKYWERFGKTHPEFFQLLPDGTRGPWKGDVHGRDTSMCVSQPALWKQVVEEWLPEHRTAQGRFAPLPWVNCCENDTPGACTCAACRSWDGPDERFTRNNYWNGSGKDPLKSHGKAGRLADVRWGESGTIPPTDAPASVADRYANFYNHVLWEARKHIPKARVFGYAYCNYEEAPLKTKVDPGVVIGFVPRHYFPYTRLEMDHFRKEWMGWRKAGVKDFIYRPNYTHALGNYPVDSGRGITEDFAFAFTNGMIGCNFDSLMGAWSAAAMQHYALTRAFRDPLRGYDKARADVVSAFGKADAAANRYFDYIEKFSDSWTYEAFQKVRWANRMPVGTPGGGFVRQAYILGDFYSDEFFKDAYALLDAVAAAAEGDVVVLSRVEFLRKGIRNTEFTRACRIAHKAWSEDKDDTAKKAAFDAAFAAMNDYRASVEGDCAFNPQAAKWENAMLDWPHKPVDFIDNM